MSNNDNGSEKRTGKRFGTQHIIATIFGIFMIVVYVGMGILFLIDFFGWSVSPTWNVLRWIAGIALIIYGFWRAYRQFSGIDRSMGEPY